MLVVAQKNTNPAVIHAIVEDQAEHYPQDEWLHDPESAKTLIAQGVTPYNMAVTDTEVIQRTIDPAVALAEAKTQKSNQIDDRTTELIDAGFQYNGKTFSLSRQAQQNLAGLLSAIAVGVPINWPKTWNTLDDTDIEEVSDQAEFMQFYGAAMGTVEAYLNGGTALKNQVRSATTIEEVNAVVDTR